MFSRAGRSGYVLKPELLRKKGAEKDKESLVKVARYVLELEVRHPRRSIVLLPPFVRSLSDPRFPLAGHLCATTSSSERRRFQRGELQQRGLHRYRRRRLFRRRRRIKYRPFRRTIPLRPGGTNAPQTTDQSRLVSRSSSSSSFARPTTDGQLLLNMQPKRFQPHLQNDLLPPFQLSSVPWDARFSFRAYRSARCAGK